MDNHKTGFRSIPASPHTPPHHLLYTPQHTPPMQYYHSPNQMEEESKIPFYGSGNLSLSSLSSSMNNHVYTNPDQMKASLYHEKEMIKANKEIAKQNLSVITSLQVNQQLSQSTTNSVIQPFIVFNLNPNNHIRLTNLVLTARLSMGSYGIFYTGYDQLRNMEVTIKEEQLKTQIESMLTQLILQETNIDSKFSQISGSIQYIPYIDSYFHSLKKGWIFKGAISYDANSDKAFVKCSEFKKPVLIEGTFNHHIHNRIIGKRDQNRSFPNDTVLVGIYNNNAINPQLNFFTNLQMYANLPATKGDKKIRKQIIASYRDSNYKLKGAVLKIIESPEKNRIQIGLIQMNEDDQLVVHPLTKSLPDAIIDDEDIPPTYIHTNWDIPKYCRFKFKDWLIDQDIPEGILIQLISGEFGTIECETKRILYQFSYYPDIMIENWNYNSDYFSPATIQEIEQFKTVNGQFVIPDEEIAARVDLRNMFTFSIDSKLTTGVPQCLDESFSIRLVSKDLYEMYVHVADVNYFIKENGSLDQEMRERGTNIYIPYRKMQIMPDQIVLWATLKEKQDKLTISIIFRIFQNGQFDSSFPLKFVKTVVNVNKNLDYETFNKYMEKEFNLSTISEEEKQVVQHCRMVGNLGEGILKKRTQEGFLKFEHKIPFFEIDDNYRPINIVNEKTDSKAAEMVEQFMIVVNYLAAEYLLGKMNKKNVILRRQPPIPDEKIAFLDSKYKLNNGEQNESKLEKIRRALDIAKGKSDLEYDCLGWKILMNMQKAEYLFSSGSAEEELTHFAMNVRFYTHFTCPLRRYIDILVHRLIIKTINGTPKTKLDITQDTLEHCDECERLKVQAEKESSNFLVNTFYEDKIPPRFDSYVFEIKYGIVKVHIPELDIAVVLNLFNEKRKGNVTSFGYNSITQTAEICGDDHIIQFKELDKLTLKLVVIKSNMRELHWEIVF